MATRTCTHTFEWKIFESGDRVTPASHRCALEPGVVYVVTEFHNPLTPFELNGTVFVEGRRFGYSAEYLRLVEDD